MSMPLAVQVLQEALTNSHGTHIARRIIEVSGKHTKPGSKLREQMCRREKLTVCYEWNLNLSKFSRHAASIWQAFVSFLRSQSSLTLAGHINYLPQSSSTFFLFVEGEPTLLSAVREACNQVGNFEVVNTPKVWFSPCNRHIVNCKLFWLVRYVGIAGGRCDYTQGQSLSICN